MGQINYLSQMRGTDLLNKLSESQTLAMAKKVRQMKASGKDVIGLTLGEPDFDTPRHIRDAAIEAINEGFTKYPPVAGIPELRAAVAAKYQREYQLDYEAANVLVSTGAKQALVNVIMSLVNPKDECILLAPYWVSYREMLKMADADIQVIQTGIESEYKVSPEQLEAAISPKTKLILLNNPSNPTGSVYSRTELSALVGVLEKHPHVFIIADEIYEHISFKTEPVCLASFSSIQDRVIVINGVSKGFAMTGWRIGFTIAPVWIAQLCEKYQGQVTSGACSISQKAALAAVAGDMAPTRLMRDSFKMRRDYLYEKLGEITGMKVYLPTGAFYFYPDISGFFGKKSPAGRAMHNVDDLTDCLLDEALVAVISGAAFGTENHIRISYAYSMDMLREALARMNTFFANIHD